MASALAQALLPWFRANGRALPWRGSTDPYAIWVSEIMLQQTQVDRVLPKYHEWLDRYPTFEVLAAARVNDVVETWRPLGYNIRPRRLHDIAREAVARYDGRLPDDEATSHGYLRVIDESGEDYGYSNDRFFEIELPEALEKTLLVAFKEDRNIA